MYRNTLIRIGKQCLQIRRMSTCGKSPKFETVFSLPSIKYFALFNRLKVYHIAGSALGVPGSGILEMCNIISEHSFLSTSYVALTGAAVLSIASLPMQNIIGFLYISDDNTQIKISSVNFWGNRVDKVIPVEDWIPLNSMEPKYMDAIYLTPQLSDKTKYKLLVKFGIVHNASKMGHVLE